MAIDPYAPCPCGSGKKLKFCCSDLASEIEKIHNMVAGDQPHAALKHIEQLLVKQPHRASLLDLRANLELSMKELDAARKTIETYLAAHPDSASPHAQATILAAATEGGQQAIELLQDTLERLEDEVMPQRVLEAIGATGHALLLDANIVASRGHLMLYAGIAPEGNNQAIELLMRMNLQGGLPLLLRDSLVLSNSPKEVPWAERFTESLRLANQGTWRKAEAALVQLQEEVGAEPEIVFNLALVRGWLGKTAELVAGLRAYAECSRQVVDKFNKTEAVAMAQLLDSEQKVTMLDTVRLEYPITDEEVLSQRFVSDGRMDEHSLDPDMIGSAEGIQPRSTYVLLDRPIAPSGVDLPLEEISVVLGFVAVYGKRTDRDAYLEVTADQDETFQQVQSLIAEIAGDAIESEGDEKVVGEKLPSEAALSWRWRLPNDTPPAHRQKLLAERRRIALTEHWPAAPQAALGDKSPEQAAGDTSLATELAACVLIVQQAAVDPEELKMFDEVRAKLKMSPAEKVDPTDHDLERIPLVRILDMDLAKIDDEPLAHLLNRLRMVGAQLTALLVARELVSRESAAEEVDLSHAYRELIRLESDPDDAHQWIEKACAWSQSKGQSTAPWTLHELELAIEQNKPQEVQRVLGEISQHHMQEPGVAEAVYKVLQSAGLLAAPSESMPPPAEKPASELWTPESEQPAASEKKSALWTPS